jgi:ABC-type multidrug transport system fused ATPase/permease subunit
MVRMPLLSFSNDTWTFSHMRVIYILYWTDTQKLFEVTQDGHLIWALPLSIVLVTTCLLIIMGPTTLAGIAVLILMVPVVQWITKQMFHIRQKRINMTDQRIQIASSMLRGIKVTKLNAYEENYEQRVLEARNKELVYLRQEMRVWGLSLVLIVIAPILASSVTFTFYVLIDEGNILTASQSFSVLLLFSALRFPINLAGRLLGSTFRFRLLNIGFLLFAIYLHPVLCHSPEATQAYSAAHRIARFLDREVRAMETLKECNVENHNEGPPLLLEKASFSIGSSLAPSFEVGKFNVSVQKGEVLAVCGPVGGGKSSLVNGIIGELSASPSSMVRVNGPLFLVTQDAFILNTTVRENILFGQAMDPTLYDRVLEACCLLADLELFGRSNDLTEIGERGITLSGGMFSLL